MARTSKKTRNETSINPVANKSTEQSYSVGIYARLSVDSHNNKNESIETQIEIAKECMKLHKEMSLFDCYIDLGKTGTNFERESFQRLMTDIRKHNVNCVIVKDFSRFGRDYIETGNYIEKIFPFLGVRFISVTDQYDSFSKNSENSNWSMNLKNLVNSMYAKDIALRVKTAKKLKQEQGSYMGGIPPYGYRTEWKEGKRVLLPKSETAVIVKEIYHLYDQNKSMKEIITYLYEKKVHRPKEYRSTGHVFQEAEELLIEWGRNSIRAILTNPVYLGVLVQGRLSGKEGKREKKQITSKQNWCVMENTHEALIDSELFYRVSNKFEKQAKIYYNRFGFTKIVPPEQNIVEGILFCGECGRPMTRTQTLKKFSSGDIVRRYAYNCNYLRRIDQCHCEKKWISKENLLLLLTRALCMEFQMNGIEPNMVVNWNQQEFSRKKEIQEKEIYEIERNTKKIHESGSKQYIQYRIGELSKEAFQKQKEEKEEMLQVMEERKQEVQKKLENMEQIMIEKNNFLCRLMKWEQTQLLDREIIQALVKKIIVYPEKRVEIVFQFKSCDIFSITRKSIEKR